VDIPAGAVDRCRSPSGDVSGDPGDPGDTVMAGMVPHPRPPRAVGVVVHSGRNQAPVGPPLLEPFTADTGFAVEAEVVAPVSSPLR
jgi:hypothetical protein